MHVNPNIRYSIRTKRQQLMNQVIDKILACSKPFEDSDFMPNVLGEYRHEAVNGHIPVILFGAGSLGIRLCNALRINGVNISCFCDNDPEIIGGECAEHPVISTEHLKRDHLESLIIISVSRSRVQEIRNQLLSLGFSNDSISIPPFDSLLYYSNVVKLYWSIYDLHAHAEQLKDTYDLLFDHKSKELFIHRMALFAGGFDYRSFERFIDTFADLISNRSPDLFSSPRYDENHFYFNSDFLPLDKNEVFANVGALVGECAIEFAKACEAKGFKYREIVNFEPDPSNFLLLRANMEHLKNVTCLPYGLWSHRSSLRFSNPAQSALAGTPGWLDENGDQVVQVVSLDEELPNANITFMKMDVEGAENEAIKGAAETIRRNKPKLAISLYHKRDDIFEIPLLIHQLYPGYKFYLRHHSTTFSETVLFAVP